MSPWRLELLRLWRTRRLIALGATFLFLGLSNPIFTYYLPDLVKNPGNGIQIIMPKPTAADGINSFSGNVAQLGTLVVVIVAAATLAFDAHPVLAAFYRTRVRQPARLVLPRYLAITCAAILTLALGTAGAWYETVVLLGSVPAGKLAAGFGLEALYLCFATSLATAFSSVTRSVIGAAGLTIAVLLALAFLSTIAAVSPWLPVRLASGLGMLLQSGAPGVPWRATGMTCIAIASLLALAVERFGRREL